MQFMNIFNKIIVENYIVLILVGLAFISDFITGIAKAIKNKNFQSSKLRSCVAKFLCYCSALIVGIIAEIMFETVCLKMVAIFLICTEVVSIIENLSKLNVKMPAFIINLFTNSIEK